MLDESGREIARPFQIETLEASIAGMVQGEGGGFVGRVAAAQLGGKAPKRYTLSLAREDRERIVLRVDTSDGRGTRASIELVVAKVGDDAGERLRNEHRFLGIAHRRAADGVVRPHLGGTLFLPDRHRRRDKARVLYAYATDPLGRFDLLGLEASGQCVVLGADRKLCSLPQSEAIRGILIATFASAYDPERGEGIAIPDVPGGDVAVRVPARGLPKCRLIRCRRLVRYRTPAAFLDAVVAGRWRVGRSTIPVAPLEPETLARALVGARGRAKAAEWLREYSDAVAAGSYRAPDEAYIAGLQGEML